MAGHVPRLLKFAPFLFVGFFSYAQVDVSDVSDILNEEALYGVKSEALLDCSALIVASEFVARQADANIDIGDEEMLMQAALNTIKNDYEQVNRPFEFDKVLDESKTSMISKMKSYVDLIIENIETDANAEVLEKDMLKCAEMGAVVSARFEND